MHQYLVDKHRSKLDVILFYSLDRYTPRYDHPERFLKLDDLPVVRPVNQNPDKTFVQLPNLEHQYKNDQQNVFQKVVVYLM